MDGQTLREHLTAWQRQTGRVHERLGSAPKLPAGCGRLWSDFLALHNCRGATGFGPARIAFADIDAYQRVARVCLEPWEIAAIRKADSAFMAVEAERRKP